MNKKNILILIVVAFILFSAGYVTGKMKSETITREVKIGVENSKTKGQIDYKKIISDAENQTAIDNFMMIYLHSKPIDNVDIDKNNPDLFIKMDSPKQSTGLVDSKVWFTDNGAIIGFRSGETWKNTEYKNINQDDADYIRDQME